jgi:hypothetical protein
MEQTINELLSIVKEFNGKFAAFDEKSFSQKPSPNKWSKKEVIGHLIDSAQNNLRRFIVGQYDVSPAKIIYDQDFWVNANGYQQMSKEEVIKLWVLMNERIAAVLRNMPKSNYNKQIMTSELHTLNWLAEDYVKHMKHHLNQVIEGSFDVNYK